MYDFPFVESMILQTVQIIVIDRLATDVNAQFIRIKIFLIDSGLGTSSIKHLVKEPTFKAKIGSFTRCILIVI